MAWRSVLIVGGAGWRNVGDDLIADRLIRRAMTAGHPVVVAGGPSRLPWLPAGVRQVALSGGTLDRVRLLGEIARAREVWIGGGGLFDDRHPAFYRPFYRVARAARLLRTPFRVTAVGVGPIRREGTAGAYRWVFEHAASATVRDEASRERIRSTESRRLPEVVSDPALWQPGAGTLEPVSRHDLLVNLRKWEYGDRTELPATTRTEAVVDAVAEALNQMYPPTATIGLVSMSAWPGDDDAGPLEALACRLRAQVSRYYGCDMAEVERLTAGAERVLSMRLHLCLLGVAHGVPTAAIAYDPKVEQQGRMHGFASVPLDGVSSASITDALVGVAS